MAFEVRNDYQAMLHTDYIAIQKASIGIFAKLIEILAAAGYAHAFDDPEAAKQPGVGADTAAADLQALGKVGEAERTTVHDEEGEHPAGDPRQAVLFHGQGQLLDKALDGCVGFHKFTRGFVCNICSVYFEQTVNTTHDCTGIGFMKRPSILVVDEDNRDSF